jgi:translation initiation factor IF-2
VKQDLFLRQLEELGFENITQESIMTGETAALVAQEYGFEPSVDIGEGVDLRPRPAPADPSTLPPRPPVVTIMGHVDHGKTTLLDYLRKSSVAAQEHGGITQHIGAFSVKMSSGKQITFLDTPGHAAFLTMRQRGAHVTDIVILVVAADDSVKPQTIEALKHARASKVPIIVAINKVDKEGARIDLVKSDLAKNGVEIEDYGGDVQVVCVSGKTGQGMGDLEENIITLSEILDMRAETDGMAEGWVLESSVKPIGRVATVLVKRGTLRTGDCIVAGKVWGKVRVLRNEAGVEITEAPPGTPVEILGWRELPDAGDQVLQAPDEGKAKDAAHYRIENSEREKAVAEMTRVEQEKRERERAAEADGDEDSPATDPETGPKIINFVVKGDVHGSVEAVCASVEEIGSNEVRPRILRSAPGQITESDVEHAATSGSIIINFNNPIPSHIKGMADGAGVKILDHNIIYHLTDDIRGTLSEHLTPLLSTKVVGEAEVLQVFPINLKGRVFKNIAGCRVRNGQVTRNAKYRVLRRGEKVFEGTFAQSYETLGLVPLLTYCVGDVDSLKHGKKDVPEIRKGAECGISFVDWEDFRQGDQIQAFEEISTQRHL